VPPRAPPSIIPIETVSEVSPALFHSPCVKSRLIHESFIRLFPAIPVGLFISKNSVMLKVIITECGGSPTEWEWRICDVAGQPLRLAKKP
jgi:hypothetical protein